MRKAPVEAVASAKSEYQLCTRCVMDTSDVDITFDDNGECIHCTTYEAKARHAGRLEPHEKAEKLARAVEIIKREGKGRRYDCVVGLSGGVDSSYVALKVKELGLRPLAVHLDNGWNSEIAVGNIERVVRSLGIDLYTWVLDWEEFRDLQLAYLRAGTPDYEIPSDHAIYVSNFKTAWRFRIPWLVLGHNVASELVLPISWAQGHSDWPYLRSVHERYGRRPLRTFPHFNAAEYFRFRRWGARRSFAILNHLDYDRGRAIAELERAVGWRNYGGKHYESIYTRFVQGYMLPVRFGYDKRRAHLASQVLSGQKTRDEALAILKTPTYESEDLLEQDRIFVLKKLGLTEPAFEEIMAAPRRTAADFDSLFTSRPYRAGRTVYRAARAALGISR